MKATYIAVPCTNKQYTRLLTLVFWRQESLVMSLLLGHIADVGLVTHGKYCDNPFRGFGVLIPPILPFSIGIAGRPYNSVITTSLQYKCTDKYRLISPF